MPLTSQYESIPFTKGLETKVNPFIVDKGKLLALQNYSFNKAGTLNRRDAWVALSGTNTLSGLSTQAELFTQDQQLLAIDNTNNLSAYTPGASSKYKNIGQAPYCSVRKDAIRRSGGTQSSIDSATSNNITAFVYQDNTSGTNGIFCSVLAEKTGNIIVNNLQIVSDAAAKNPRVTVVNGSFCFLWVSGTQVKFAAMLVGGTTLSVAAQNLAPNFKSGTPGLMDVATYSNTPGICVYSSSTANHDLDALTFNETGAVTSGPNLCLGTIQGLHTSLAIVDFSASRVWVIAGVNGSSVDSVTQDISGGTLQAPSSTNNQGVFVAPANVTGVLVGSACQVFSMPLMGGVPGLQKISTYSLSSGNVSSGESDFQNTIDSVGGFVGPNPAAKAFTNGTSAFLPVYVLSPGSTNLQNTIFVLDTSGNIIAKALIGTGPTVSVGIGVLGSSVSLGNNSISIPVGEQTRVNFSAGINTTQFNVSRIKLTFGRTTSTTDYKTTPLWHARADQVSYLSGGNLMFYDGGQVVEAGFHYFPEGITATRNAGAGNLTAGSYQYVAVYEWIDNTGDRHQSAPSPAVTVTSSGGDSADLTCPTLQLGKRAASTYIVFYRTKANGTIFYRVTDSGGSGPNGAVLNDIATKADLKSSTGDFTRNSQSDTSIGSNEVLYTQPFNVPTTLPNDAPPACRAITNFQNRIFIGGLEDPYEIRYSQPVLTAQGVGLQWNELLSLRLPQGYGEVTAFGVIDDKLIIFTPSHYFVMFGNGPDSTGLNVTYSLPQIIPSSVGCIDQRTIAQIPDVSVPDTGVSKGGGLCFQSKHGYYLLNRGLSTEHVGFEVENDILNQVITSAVVLEDRSQLRLTIPATNNVLVYDYMWGQWSLFTGFTANSFGPINPFIPASACVWNNLFTFLDAQTNFTFQDDTNNTFLDNAVNQIICVAQTSWIKLSALQGFERIRRIVILGNLGNSTADSALSVDVNFNYAPPNPNTGVGTGPGAYSFTIASTNAITPAGRPFEFRHHMQQQNCEAVNFQFIDIPTLSNPAGVNLTGITLELAMKKGVGKHLPSAQNF